MISRKKLSELALAIIAFLGITNSSQSATVVPFSDTLTASQIGLSGKLYEHNTYSYQHDLSYLGIPPNKVLDATITMTFKDDGGASDSSGSKFWGLIQWDYREEVSVSFDSGSQIWDINGGADIIPNKDTTPWDFDFNLNVSSINDDGILDVEFWLDNPKDSKWCGSNCVADIFFLESTVEGHLTPVPLPAAAWFFGSALLGLVAFSRRRKKTV